MDKRHRGHSDAECRSQRRAVGSRRTLRRVGQSVPFHGTDDRSLLMDVSIGVLCSGADQSRGDRWRESGGWVFQFGAGFLSFRPGFAQSIAGASGSDSS